MQIKVYYNDFSIQKKEKKKKKKNNDLNLIFALTPYIES